MCTCSPAHSMSLACYSTFPASGCCALPVLAVEQCRPGCSRGTCTARRIGAIVAWRCAWGALPVLLHSSLQTPDLRAMAFPLQSTSLITAAQTCTRCWTTPCQDPSSPQLLPAGASRPVSSNRQTQIHLQPVASPLPRLLGPPPRQPLTRLRPQRPGPGSSRRVRRPCCLSMQQARHLGRKLLARRGMRSTACCRGPAVGRTMRKPWTRRMPWLQLRGVLLR